LNERLKQVARALGLRRSTVAAARMRVERNLLALRAPREGPGRSRILCYHSVGTPSWGVNDVTPEQFRRHLRIAGEEGFRFVPAEKIAHGEGRPGDLAITFDDGLTTVLTNAAPILEELGIPWTLFVVSDWAEGKHPFGEGTMLDWDQIGRLAERPGVTLGSHSVTHPRFSLLAKPEIDRELVESRRRLEARLGLRMPGFAIPLGQSGDWTPECAAAARAAGYELVYAQAEETRSADTVARTFVSRYDDDRVFRAALRGAFDRWEEWL
jgi:peptidoglycan/xylan/chitin deacetylase (PgdA/CDA1 family)